MLKNKDENLILDEKVKIFEFLANIFAREPDVEFLKGLQEENNAKILGSCEDGPLSDVKQLSVEDQVEAIAVEYARLFLAPMRLASPYESLQLGEGRLWGKSTVEVNKIYRKFGFALDEGFNGTPDHLSAELFFLAQLSQIESEYLSKGLKEEQRGVLEVKKYFLKHHVLKWFPDFKKAVINNAEISYYKDIVILLGNFLDEEYEILANVKDI